MKKLNYWILLLVAAMLMPALTVQAKGKKDKNVVAEQTTGAQDREQWVKWLWKISYPVIHNLAEGTLHQNMPIETVGGDPAGYDEITHLEAVGRTLAGVAPWLALPDDDTEEGKLRKQMREEVLKGLKNAVDFCAIINARSGHCQENCKFCAQSGWYHTGAKVYRLLPEDEILEAAKKAKAAGAVRFSLVTSGRNQDNPNEFEEIIDIVKKIREQVGIEVCCSLGLITKEQAIRLKEAGITRIHCNIETAPSYFPEVCSTHSMEDKEVIIRTAQEAGIRVCSGGIIGLGESLDQRVEMAFKLKSMHIDSAPMNILNPVKGTPFYTNRRLPPLEVLRTFAMFRFVLPKALIRTAGGREVNLRSLQAYALTGGLNGIMVGGYLTTGGRDPKEDIRMTEDLGRSMTQPQL